MLEATHQALLWSWRPNLAERTSETSHQKIWPEYISSVPSGLSLPPRELHFNYLAVTY